MIRKLLATVFSVSTLFFAAMVFADPATAPNGVLPLVESNKKLLLPFIVSEQNKVVVPVATPTVYEIPVPYELPVLTDPLHEIDRRIASKYFSSDAVNSSA